MNDKKKYKCWKCGDNVESEWMLCNECLNAKKEVEWLDGYDACYDPDSY